MDIKEKILAYINLTRLNRPIGIYLLLWPTLWTLFLVGEGYPDYSIVLVFVAGVILMRSAGCAINDYADRNIDPLVRRTKDRPLAARKIKPVEAIIVFTLLSISAFSLVIIFLNTLTLWFSLVAVALAISYPFTKRLHYLPQVHLGIAFAWAIPMAFVAHTDTWPPPWGWLLFVATIIWTTAYDTIYGMVDREDDIKIGVRSTAILFGKSDRLIVGILQAFVVLCLISIGVQNGLSYWYYLSVMGSIGFFIYQQYLIYYRDPEECFKAFLNNNYIGLIIFLGIVASFWMPF